MAKRGDGKANAVTTQQEERKGVQALLKRGAYQEALVAVRKVRAAEGDRPELLYELGIAASGADSLEEAEGALSAAVALGYQDPRAYGELARVRVRRGYANTAIEPALKAIDLSKSPLQRAWAMVSLGQARLALEQYDAARQVFEEANALDPNNAYAEFALGMLAARQGDHARAIAHLLKCTEIRPGHGYTWMCLGRTAIKSGRIRLGVNALKRALELGLSEPQVLGTIDEVLQGIDPDEAINCASLLKALATEAEVTATLNFRIGYANWLLGRGHAARDYYERAIKRLPTHSLANYNLGLLLLEEGAPDAARPHLEIAVSALPNDPDTHFALGKALSRSHQYEEAHTELAQALKVGRDAAPINLEVAYAFKQQGRFEEAVQAARKAISAARPPEEQAAVYSTLGFSLTKLGDLAAARESYRQAVDLQPFDCTALYSLGLCELDQGLFNEARQHLQASVERGGDDSARLALAQAELELDNVNEAETLFRGLLVSAEHETASIQLIDLLCRTDRMEEGLALASAEAERYPHSPVALAGLSIALMFQGDPEGARAAIRQAEQLDRDNPWVDWARTAGILMDRCRRL